MIAIIGGLLLRSDYVETNIDTKEQTEVTQWQLYEVTAYTLHPSETGGKQPGHPAYGLTATGEYVRDGITAACPPKLAPYTRIEIEGVGVRVCHDTGRAIVDVGKRGLPVLDVYMESRSEAWEFGRKRLHVRIIENGGDANE